MLKRTNDSPQTNPTRGRWGRSATTRHATGDEGISLVEILVVMGLVAVLAAVILPMFHFMTQEKPRFEDRVDLNTDLQDAQLTINRDVDDAINIRTADAQELELVVIRDGACNVRHYVADPAVGKLTVTTTFFEQRACRGPSSERVQDLVKARYTSTGTFTYWGESPTIPIPAPVQDLRNVRAVQWNLSGAPYGNRDAPDIELSSSAVYTGLGESQGDGTPQVQALRPLLTVTTAIVGRDAPVLTWTDATPELTVSYVVRRAEAYEGTRLAPPLTVATVPAGVTTWTDTGLAPGQVAVYVVLANLTDGAIGPASNSVVAGLRPSTPTGVTATGHPGSIAVTWNPVPGATAYDVYRDGELRGQIPACPRSAGSLDRAVCTAPAVTTWTDGPGESGWTGSGYGHSHTYAVVATNRWEAGLTAGSQDGRVPLGTPVGATFTAGTVRLASAVTAASGAFTAPAQPGIAVTPRADWSNLVARSFAPWVGAGPTSKAGVHRDRTIEVQAATLSGPWQALWTWAGSTPNGVHGARPAGATTRYQLRACNDVGCSGWTAASALQRPPAPASCTASAGTTRSLQVTINPTAMESSATGYVLAGGTAASGYSVTGTGVSAGPVFAVDQLRDATSHSFSAQTRNASPANGGLSDPVACGGSTADLVAYAPSVSTTGGGVAPVTVRVTASGGGSSAGTWSHEVKFGSGGTPLAGSTRAYTESDPGSVSGYGRTVATDGVNNAQSAWVYGGAVTVTDPYPSPWGSSAPGCPSLQIYVPPTSAATFTIRRASSTQCQVRWTLTTYGADGVTKFVGDVVDTGSYTLGSGATAFIRTGGSGVYPMSPLWWP